MLTNRSLETPTTQPVFWRCQSEWSQRLQVWKQKLRSRWQSALRPLRRRPELLLFSLVLVLFNAPVVLGASSTWFLFHPEAVRQGEWWRLFTHPFVHVTWYHLLLDGSAFLLLYHSLLESAPGRRLAYVFAGAAGSLLLSWATATSAIGLCGLSGIAHGLMAISALELVTSQPLHSAERRVGWASFGFVVVKAAFEALSGRMFFAFLDFGLLGSPVAVSHAGGIVGGLLAFLALKSGKPGHLAKAQGAKMVQNM